MGIPECGCRVFRGRSPLDTFWIEFCPLHGAAPKLLYALSRMDLSCSVDRLNPCWDNRPTDQFGLHWGSTPETPIPACQECYALAVIHEATHPPKQAHTSERGEDPASDKQKT